MSSGFLLAASGFALRLALAAESSIVFDMDTIRHQPGAVGPEKAPVGTVALVVAWDKTHLGEAGHRLAADTVFQALQEQSPSTPRR